MPNRPKLSKVTFENCYKYLDLCETSGSVSAPLHQDQKPCKKLMACLDEENFKKLFQNKYQLRDYILKLENLLKPFTINP